MKILQVTPRYPPQSGGVETHVREISERLVDRGHEVTVITADAGPESERQERRNGVTVRRYRSLTPNGAIHFCPQITAAVRRANVDVVHAHNYHSFPLFFAAVGVGDQQFVVTMHYHGGSANSLRDRLLSMYRPFGRWAVRRADKVIAVSEWESEQLETDFRVGTTVIPNGVDMDRLVEAESLNRRRPYLLTVGRLEEYKGIQHVIRALSMLTKYELIIAGDGSYRKQLIEVTRDSGVSDRVDFVGYVDGEKLPGLYAEADVFLNLSAYEAYGITVGEALATGTPCVVREAGALESWTQYDGCVGVAAVDRQTVADAVEAVVGQTVTVRPPTWEEVTNRVIDCYERQR